MFARIKMGLFWPFFNLEENNTFNVEAFVGEILEKHTLYCDISNMFHLVLQILFKI